MENKGEVQVATFSEVSCEVHGNGAWFDKTNDEKDVKPEVCDKHSPVPHSISAAGVDDVGREKNVTPRRHANAHTIVSAIKGKNDDPNKKSRRVYFPEGGTIVAGYKDPPKPWNDAASCSTEDLVCAYQVACEKHGVKVIPKLLQQLQAINDFTDRNETLSLRGERLDQRHCETIEEILRRVQFRTIDLEATHLDVEGAVALFDMIEYYQSATRLNISYNRNVGPRGWQAFARMLKKTPCLEQLEARSCSISEQVMPMLGRSLRMGSLLTTLHLENSIMSGRHLMILVAAIKMNEALKELYLADNRLMPSDGIQLGNMLKYNHHLLLLDVRNNHLQDVGTSHICDGICEQGSGLSTIVLWNNQLTFQSMAAVSRALVTTKSLQTLNVGHNNITNEGVFRLKDGMLRNKSLLRIGMQAVKISCEGAVAIAEFIADSPRLLRIDLRENDVKTAGLMALALSFKVSPTLTRLDLDKEPKKESGVKDYAEQQRRLIQDIVIYGQRNRELARKREEEEKLKEKLLEEEAELRGAEGRGDGDLGSVEQRSEKEGCVEELEKGTNAVDNLKQNMHLKLVTSGGTRDLTLESPAFVSEFALPVTEPPPETTEATPVDDATNDVTMSPEYPLSPVILSKGKTILTPVPQQPLPVTPSPPESPATCQVSCLSTPQGTPDKSPQTSPNNRRRFIICKVNEHSNRKAKPGAAHIQPPVEYSSVQSSTASGSCDSGKIRTVTDAVPGGTTNNADIPGLAQVGTNRTAMIETSTHPLSNMSQKNKTVGSVQGLVDSIVDHVIHDVIGQYESAQCVSIGESGDTSPCHHAGFAHRPIDTGCGDVSGTGDTDGTAATGTATTRPTLLSEDIPRVGTVDSEPVVDDTTGCIILDTSGTGDSKSGGETPIAPSDIDQTECECPDTVHSSTHTSCELAGDTSYVNASDLVSSGQSMNESELVSSGQSVNESEEVSSSHSAHESGLVSSSHSAHESGLLSSGQSANESELVSPGQSVNKSELVSYGQSVNKSELVSSGQSVNKSELVSCGQSVNKSELVSSGQGVNESEVVSSGHSAHESGLVSSGQSANESELVSSGQSVDKSELVSSDQGVNKSEVVSSGQSANESKVVSSSHSAHEFGLVSSGHSAHESWLVSSGNSAHESGLVSSSHSAHESGLVSSGHSAHESGLVSSGHGAHETGLVSSSHSAHESGLVSSGHSVYESVSSESGLVKCAEPSIGSVETGEVSSASKPTTHGSCAVDRGNSNVSAMANKTDADITEVDQCPTDEMVSPKSSESPKSGQCHAESDLHNCGTESATSERYGGTAASPSCVTVSPSLGLCQQTEPNLHSTLTMNGMRVELASVLDSLDQQLDPLATEHDLVQRDDIEQEIEDMLAGVQT